VRRRNFIATLIGATAATTLAGLPLPKFVDPYDQFLLSLGERVKHILIRDETTLVRMHIDPPHFTDGQKFRFVRLWTQQSGDKPLTWNEPCPY